MKNALRILAVLVALGVAAYWASAGANRGWTKDQVAVTVRDEVTGIDEIRWEKRFVPGVEFLAAGLTGAAMLLGASFLFRNKSKQTNHSQSTL